MNNKIKEIALQVGGSHYPEVNSQLLEKFAFSIIEECAKIADCPSSFKHKHGYKIRKHFGISNDAVN